MASVIDRIDYAIQAAGLASPCLSRWILADLLAYRHASLGRLVPPMEARPARAR